MRLFAGTPFDIPPKCERCEKLVEECRCPPEKTPFLPPQQQTAKISMEKRKRGKIVTVVGGLSPQANDLPALLSKLQSACGAGGTIADEALEIQGEHRERIRELLQMIGYRVKI